VLSYKLSAQIHRFQILIAVNPRKLNILKHIYPVIDQQPMPIIQQAGADLWLRPSIYTRLFAPSVIEKTRLLKIEPTHSVEDSSSPNMATQKEISTDKAPTFDQTKFPFSQAVSFGIFATRISCLQFSIDCLQWHGILLWKHWHQPGNQDIGRRHNYRSNCMPKLTSNEMTAVADCFRFKP